MWLCVLNAQPAFFGLFPASLPTASVFGNEASTLWASPGSRTAQRELWPQLETAPAPHPGPSDHPQCRLWPWSYAEGPGFGLTRERTLITQDGIV